MAPRWVTGTGLDILVYHGIHIARATAKTRNGSVLFDDELQNNEDFNRPGQFIDDNERRANELGADYLTLYLSARFREEPTKC